MTIQSLSTSPSKPSPSRRISCMMRRLIVAGTPDGSICGNRMWLLIIAGIPASIAARNGTSSVFFSSARLLSMQGRPRWESTAVSPWPGKCLPQQSMPPFL